MIHKRNSPHPGKTVVTFEIPDTIWAERINLVGDFNDWDTGSLPFRHGRGGNWQIELHLDSGHEYRFGYLLDGVHWRYDWHADKYAPNPHGGFDSIVVAGVPPSTTTSDRLTDPVVPRQNQAQGTDQVSFSYLNERSQTAADD